MDTGGFCVIKVTPKYSLRFALFGITVIAAHFAYEGNIEIENRRANQRELARQIESYPIVDFDGQLVDQRYESKLNIAQWLLRSARVKAETEVLFLLEYPELYDLKVRQVDRLAELRLDQLKVKLADALSLEAEALRRQFLVRLYREITADFTERQRCKLVYSDPGRWGFESLHDDW